VVNRHLVEQFRRNREARSVIEISMGIFTPITLKDKMKELSPAQRKKVEARAAQLIAEEMTLRELRHARKLTQVKMAKRSRPWAVSQRRLPPS